MHVLSFVVKMSRKIACLSRVPNKQTQHESHASTGKEGKQRENIPACVDFLGSCTSVFQSWVCRSTFAARTRTHRACLTSCNGKGQQKMQNLLLGKTAHMQSTREQEYLSETDCPGGKPHHAVGARIITYILVNAGKPQTRHTFKMTTCFTHSPTMTR